MKPIEQLHAAIVNDGYDLADAHEIIGINELPGSRLREIGERILRHGSGMIFWNGRACDEDESVFDMVDSFNEFLRDFGFCLAVEDNWSGPRSRDFTFIIQEGNP